MPAMQFDRKRTDILFSSEVRNQGNVQTSNGRQHIRSNHLEWYLLAEYALSEMMPDNGKRDELTAGFLYRPFRALGIPPECIESIEMTLTGFANEALVPFKQGRPEQPGSIRVFCPKKIIADADSAKTLVPYYAEPGMEQAPAIPYPGTNMNGGWGYFLIERGGNLSADSSVSSWNSIDLYLYKEGE